MTRPLCAMLVCALASAPGLRASAQTQFQNLDFSAAAPQVLQLFPNYPIGTYMDVPFGSAFPGWTGYIGPNQTNFASVNCVTLGACNIAILGDSVHPNAALLQSGPITLGPAESVALAQAGLVPLDARSIQMKVGLFGFDSTIDALAVSIGGQSIPMSWVSRPIGGPVFAGDVSAFAGMTSELRITVSPIIPVNGNESITLGAISFSPMVVPEPKGLRLLLEGLLLLALSRIAQQQAGKPVPFQRLG